MFVSWGFFFSKNPCAPEMYSTERLPRDSHVRVSYQDNLDQVQERFFASLCGVVLVIVSYSSHNWIEGKGLQTALSLDEGLRQVVHIHDIDQINPEYQDKLVHLSGSLQTDRALNDSDYGISAVNAVKLRREVEMYQWVEHEHTREYFEGGRRRIETKFSYTTEWRHTIVLSNQFYEPAGHQNPNTMSVQSYTKEADSVRVGAFSLSKGLFGKMYFVLQPLSPQEVPQGKKMHIRDGMFYHYLVPFYTCVGDVRVQFFYAGLSGMPGLGSGDPIKVSIVARQQGGRLSPYRTKSGNSLEILYPGEMSAEEIFEAEKLKNVALTWVLRVIFLVLMILGFMIIEVYNGLMMACILTALIFSCLLSTKL